MATALIIVDVQYDFLPGGALGVEGGDEVIQPIVDMAPQFDYVFATRDAHPAATSHFDHWPVHCVDGTHGAELSAAIANVASRVFDKGMLADDDGYSGFDNPGLRAMLSHMGVDTVVVVGLALDYCVKATALDAQRAGFSTTVPIDATRAVGGATGYDAITELRNAGVEVR